MAAPGAGWVGINLELTDQFIRDLNDSHQRMAQFVQRIRSELGSVYWGPERMSRFDTHLRWTAEMPPQIRRRWQLAQAAPPGNPFEPLVRPPFRSPQPKPFGARPEGFVYVDESQLLSARQAQAHGRALARQVQQIDFRALSRGEGEALPAEKLNGILAELAKHKYDPDCTGAFFGALGTALTLQLPGLGRWGYGDPPIGKVNLAIIQAAFASAVRAGRDIPEFNAVAEDLATGRDRALPINRGIAPPERGRGDLLSLLGREQYPPDWIARVVHIRSTSEEGLGAEPFAGGYYFAPVLAANPAALHMISNRLSDEELRQWLSGLNTTDAAYVHDVGQMLATAAGAGDPGWKHDSEQARFAFRLMRTLPHIDRQSGLGGSPVTGPLKPYMARIAAAYPAEITDGANLADANRTLPSEFGGIVSNIPGLNPAFRLSPGDTYRFLTMFADSAQAINIHETGMGDFSRYLITEAIKRDAGKDTANLERVMEALGSAAGVQLAAEGETLGIHDKEELEERQRLAFAASLALGVAGLAIPGMGGQILWLALSTGAGIGINNLTEIDETQVSKVNEEGRQATLASGYWLVTQLMTNGFKVDVPPTRPQFNQPPITRDGKLLPWNEIAINPQAVRNFNNWLIRNGSGSQDGASLGEAASRSSGIFIGAKSRAEADPTPFD